MNTQTTFVEQNIVNERLSIKIDDIVSLYAKINFIFSEELYPLKKNSYHFIAQLLKKIAPDDRITRALAATLFKSCYQAEILSAGGANIAFLFGVVLAKELIKTPLTNINTQDIITAFDNLILLYKNQLQTNSNITKSNDLKEIINKTCEGDQVLANVIWEAVNLAGLEGKILVENSKQNNYLVEYKEGYKFNLKPFKFFIQTGSWTKRNCKVLIVDGLVEKVSEIDHLLTRSFDTKIPMMIIAHGFSEEVVATLKANQERGLLDVLPVRIPSDIDSLNVVNDISVVCGCLPISSMKGDLIVFTKYDDLPFVDGVCLTENECSIENSKTRAAVGEQTKMILEKRQSYFLHEEVQELFDKRLKSLISSMVAIHLPNDTAIKNDERRVKIDVALRQCKTILNFGTVSLPREIQNLKSSLKTNQISQNIEDVINQVLLRTLNGFHDKLVQENVSTEPTISALTGMLLAGKSIILFMTSSGFVEII